MLNRKLLCTLLLLMLGVCVQLTAQNGIWTWMSGSTLANPTPVWGTQGVSSPLNQPPGMYEAAEWTDQNGDFWLFGGLQVANNTYNTTLWKYTVSTNEWTWMNGPQTPSVQGMYGVQGVPSPANYPGGRSYGPRSWTDLNGNLWLFGGIGFDGAGNLGLLNDLWMYNIATNEWTWMNGPQLANQPANYGTLGVPSPTNIPEPVQESAVSWIDAAGNLWTFGGIDGSTPFDSDAMWRYSIATNEWTWMSGQSTPTSVNWGTQFVPSPTNTPGGRMVYSHWQDQQGNFWLFGGTNFSDMWKYDPNTLLWTWMAGTNSLNFVPTFTTQCVPGGIPSGAAENRVCWTDQCGRFWGTGIDYTLLWMFDPVSNQFTWITGSLAYNPPVVLGTQNVPSPANYPPGFYGGNAFVDNSGNLWAFGGYNYLFGPGPSSNNQLFRFQIDSTCPAQTISTTILSATGLQGCAPYAVPFIPTGNSATLYQWDFGDTTTLADTSAAAFPVWTYNLPGTYTVTLIATNNLICGNNTDTSTAVITVFAPVDVNLGNDTTICSGIVNLILDAGNTGSYFVWNTGDTTQTITVNAPGSYSVVVSNDSNSICTDQDSIIIAVPQLPDLGNDTVICGAQTVLLNSGIQAQQYLWNTGDTIQSVTASATGTYIVQATTASCTVSDTVLVTFAQLPVVNIGNDTILCSSPFVLPLNAGNTGSTFLWNNGNPTQTITATQPGTYSVNVNNGQCSTNDTINITVQTAPQPNIGGDTAICAGQTLLLNPGVTAQQYLWNTGDTTQTITVSTPGFYTVQLINPPCTLSSSMNLSITQLPVVALGNDTTLCPNESIILNAQNAGANYAWSNAATTQTIIAASAGTYAVTVTAQNCSSTDSITIFTTQNLAFDEMVSLCGSFTPLVLDAGNTGATYLWSSGENTQAISIEQPGTYWITVSVPPCVLTDTIQVTGKIGEADVYIPNSFTPNGDGLNDRFTGIGEDFTSFHLVVFNRWGELIFETRDQSGWDGFYQNERAKGDVYVYLLSYTSTCTGGKVVDRRGAVTLIR
jgi:gliding motility-associated-like protein